MNKYSEDPASKNTEQLRADLEGTRTDVAQDIDAISDKLRPKNLAGEALAGVRDTAEKTRERVKDGAAAAFEGARNSTAVHAVRTNPIPVALMTIGAGWLLANQLMGPRRRADLRTRVEQGKGRLAEARHIAEERKDDLAERARQRGDELRGRAQQAKRVSFERAEQARGFVEQTYADHPLAMGLLTAAVGAGIGLVLPGTEREDQLVGPTRDRLLAEATRTAEQARDAAEEASKGIAQDIKHAAKDVASSGSERAQTAAERHGLG